MIYLELIILYHSTPMKSISVQSTQQSLFFYSQSYHWLSIQIHHDTWSDLYVFWFADEALCSPGCPEVGVCSSCGAHKVSAAGSAGQWLLAYLFLHRDGSVLPPRQTSP